MIYITLATCGALFIYLLSTYSSVHDSTESVKYAECGVIEHLWRFLQGDLHLVSRETLQVTVTAVERLGIGFKYSLSNPSSDGYIHWTVSEKSSPLTVEDVSLGAGLCPSSSVQKSEGTEFTKCQPRLPINIQLVLYIALEQADGESTLQTAEFVVPLENDSRPSITSRPPLPTTTSFQQTTSSAKPEPAAPITPLKTYDLTAPEIITSSEDEGLLLFEDAQLTKVLIQLFHHENWISHHDYEKWSNFGFSIPLRKHIPQEQWEDYQLTTENVGKVFDGNVIWVDNHANNFRYFTEQVGRNIKKKMVLISSGYDDFVKPYRHFKKGLNSRHICKWFSINFMERNEENQVPIPIGVGIEHWTESEKNLVESLVRDAWTKPIDSRKNKVMVALGETNIQRAALKEAVCEYEHFECFHDRLSLEEYFKTLVQFRFVLSPPGFGMDCFRTWESLLVRTIPIVKNEGDLGLIYEHFPVISLSTMEEAGTEWNSKKLGEFWDSIDWRIHDWQRLTKQYYFNSIKDASDQCKS